MSIAPDVDICPRYAMWAEFWGLLIACLRNDGASTLRRFPAADREQLARMVQVARNEGFDARLDGQTIAVKKAR